MTDSRFTHLEKGQVKMVDVSGKKPTRRLARAGGEIIMSPETLQRILDHTLTKGNVLETARLAGIMAAKKTSELIPLCHPLIIDEIAVEFDPAPARGKLAIVSKVVCTGKTGVEMEALCAVAVAALTVYDMAKSVDRTMVISNIRLMEKTGGRSGRFIRET